MSESRLIRILREKGVLDEKGLERARHLQKKLGEGTPLSQVLVRLGIVREDEMAKALAEAEALRSVERVTDDMLDYEAMMLLDDDFLRRHNIVLIRGEMGRTEVVHWEDVPFEVMEQIQFLTNRVLESVIAPRREVMDALKRYLSLGELQRRERAAEARKKAYTASQKEKVSLQQNVADESPVTRLVGLLVRKGILTEQDVVTILGDALRKKGVLSDDEFRSLGGKRPL